MPGLGLVISTRLDPETSTRFVEFCERRGVNRSDFVRGLIESALSADAVCCDLDGPAYKGQMRVTIEVTGEGDPS